MSCLVVLLLLGLFGCGTTMMIPQIDQEQAREEARLQRITAWKIKVGYDQQLHNVAFPILRSNVSFCGRKTKLMLGFLYMTTEHLEKDWRENAQADLGIGDHLTIISVAEGSPAHAAGLIPGDKIEGINRNPIGTGKRAAKNFSKLFDKYAKNGSFTLNIWRQGKRLNITVKPVSICGIPVNLANKDEINAWADGQNVWITTGMLRFVENDDDLALIVGHELAHNTQGHIEKKKTNRMLGAVLGAAVSVATKTQVTQSFADAGTLAFSQAFEAEADYVGTYFAARAGFNADNAAELWRRLAAEHPRSIHLQGSTHPSTAKRFLAIKKTVEEIQQKRLNNLPLIPEKKKNK